MKSDKFKGNSITIEQSYLRYTGSKSKLIQKYKLNEYFPRFQLERKKENRKIQHIRIYHELFCGSAIMFFNVKPFYAYLNDIDDNIYNFWFVFKTPELFTQFKDELRYTWVGDAWIDEYQQRTDNVGRALLFYIENRKGKINPSPRWFPKDFSRWEWIMDHCNLQITHDDFQVALSNCNKCIYDPEKSSTEFVIYEDPPYVDTEDLYGSGDNRFPFESHAILSKLNHESTHQIFLSYNDCDYIRELYEDWWKMELSTVSYMGKKRKEQKELFLSNRPFKRYRLVDNNVMKNYGVQSIEDSLKKGVKI